MSEWRSLQQALGLAAQSELQSQGLQVHVKTNLGPSIKVFDAKDEQSRDGLDLVKVGVSVRDESGAELYGSGDWPKTDYLLAGSLLAIGGVVIALLARGVVKQ